MAGSTFLTISDPGSTFRRLSRPMKPCSLLRASSSSTSSIIEEATTSEVRVQEILMMDLSRLASMLRLIQAVFRDAEERETDDETIQLCLNQFNEVAYDIEDVLDRFDYGAFKTQLDGMIVAAAEHSLKRKRVDDDDDIYGYQVSRLPSSSIKIPIPDNVAKRIMWIIDKFDEITNDREAHRLREEDACRRPCSDDAMKRSPNSLLMNESVVFGREADKNKIIQLLMSDSEKENTVIPIVGLGGVGKTTLAQLIYNDPAVCELFSLKAWVCISKEFDVLRVTREIVASIIRSSSDHDNNNLFDLQSMLKEALFEKRFLLILDDIWNMWRPGMWEALLAPFYGVGMGKIIVTTRTNSVARIMQTIPPHELGCLDAKNSWLLFQRHAFYGWEFDQQLNFEQIGRKISRKCGGFPLALKVVGGFLQYEIEEHTWLDVLNDELWELVETKNIILPALRISYNHLPTHLKPCFAYASLFPKDHVFDKEELITLWIAQGYIQPSRKKKLLEDIAIEYFDGLHRRSFFQLTKYGKFILHDMVHDLARSMTRNGICSLLDTNELKYIPKDAKHIFMNDIFLDDEIGYQLTYNEAFRTFVYLNSNYYFGEFHHFFKDSFHQFCFLRVLRIDAPSYACNLEFFYWIGSLRCLQYLSINARSMHMSVYSLCSLSKLQTLKLQCYKLNMLPYALGKLINLRHLILRSNIKMLPQSICQLKNLLTLDIKYCFLLGELPSGISELSNLRHLMLCKNTYIPSGIKRLINLETLPCYFLKNAEYIGRLKHLVNLRESLEIFDLHNVVSGEDAKRANLKHKHIESLKLSWTKNAKDAEAVLDGLQPPTNLEVLAIRGYGGNNFPSWFGNPHFSNLMKISLTNFNSHEECKFLPLSGLPSLRSLYIENIKGIKRIGQDFWCYPYHDGRENNFTEVHVGFLSLEVLSICNMPEWDKWETMWNGDFPCLKCLHIWRCPKLELLPTLPSSLEEFQVMSCERLKHLVLHDSSEPPSRLQKVAIQCCNLLKSIEQVPNLTHFEIRDCFNLKSVNKLDNLLIRLEILKLDGCPLLQLNLGMREWCDRHGVTYSEFEQTLEPTGNTSEVDDAIIYGREDDEKKIFLSDDCTAPDISLGQNTGETTTRVGDTVIYGREDDKKKVIKLLLSDDCSVFDISLIQIIGAGGIGKSTVAYLVYNDSMICDCFDMKAWVHMPEIIDVVRILKAIIESLTGISCYATELNELKQIIGEELSGKRFLIVLDNVRNGTQSFWGSFMVSLSIGAKGSIIMMTTRTEIISDLMGSIRPYHLKSLSDEHCFSIFLEYAFDKQDACIFPELIRTGKHIVAKCKGIPLAAKAVGSLLHFNENNLPAGSQYWKDVLESALWESDECLPALSLCYDYLPMHMKLCFKFCSLFPEGYIFEKDHLIKLWMSHGYLEPMDGEATEDIGINCFQELLRRSFFQCLHIYDGGEQKYGIHDLFHNFAQRVAVDCFRIEDSKLSFIPENISHISIVPCAVDALEFSHQFEQQSDLCTFLFVPGSASKWAGSAVHIENIIVLDDLFIKSRCLRSLDLSNTDIKELPDSIKNLKSLCYLGLNNTNIRRLPNSICSLDNLQSLELQDCSFLSDLPPNINELTKLRCLNIFKESGFISMPSGVGELINLRTLSNFNVGKVGWHCGIVELQNLLYLRGSLYIAGLENVVSGAQANQADLKMKGGLKTLTLHWFQNGWESEAETEQNALDVIQYLQPHTNIEELIIHGYFGSQFPIWLGDPLFCNLVSVTLDNCYESNVLPPLGQLPSLKFLKLQKLDSIRTLGLEFYGSSSEVPRGFPSLEILKLWEMSELEEWNCVWDEDFPQLRRLSISMCFKLIKLPPLNHLRELDFHCCDRLPEIPRLKSLEYLKIDGFQKLESLSLPDDLPALKKLEINNCGRLSLVFGMSQLVSVEQFKVSKCPQFFLNERCLENHQAVNVSGNCLLPSACSFEVPIPHEVSTQTTPPISHSNEQTHCQTGISAALSSASSTPSSSLSSINLVTLRASIPSHCEEKSQSAALVGSSADGYNWYGFKELKCGEHLKIYFYKCCYPECAVRKWELSFDSIVRQMFYKGQHSHLSEVEAEKKRRLNLPSALRELHLRRMSETWFK